ncbi:SWIB/MDM2 domain protein [Talaromyces stipitatus ATCC 10500]|uniref:SWIB/MDM2 domain protein n=1 Tax=Talaromyces stipitatus (strain ATCC 10500 / CBS 375.48 / QM 6759 / NRRL 1006) TaxID=441959 RepID=B8MB22_TALSN|nr:SWIB/MDM2 domain protein [Talaromyces stipitatus ATCC 10500]EED18722.1 SWIB/MDM2 domain protein [Talaromyces stipitatus ATCC 10500]
MSLSSEQRASFTKVIDSILAASDINTISSKRIRQGLQATVDYDLNDYKAPVKELIMERFDLFMNKKDEPSTPPEDVVPSTETANGHGNGSPAQETSHSPPTASSSPQRKREAESLASDGTEPKKRRPDHDVDADAEFAAKLQAEENKRARPTRGSATRKVAPSKKKSKAKTSKKIRAEDDSDLESTSETGAKKEVNRSGGFHKPLNLSPALSELLDGEVALSRPQTVKRVWEYIKANDLQDPSDRRQIRCDDRMRLVFKQDRVHMFTMTKILNQNLYDPGE